MPVVFSCPACEASRSSQRSQLTPETYFDGENSVPAFTRNEVRRHVGPDKKPRPGSLCAVRSGRHIRYAIPVRSSGEHYRTTLAR
jgi:hypothetical protein